MDIMPAVISVATQVAEKILKLLGQGVVKVLGRDEVEKMVKEVLEKQPAPPPPLPSVTYTYSPVLIINTTVDDVYALLSNSTHVQLTKDCEIVLQPVPQGLDEDDRRQIARNEVNRLRQLVDVKRRLLGSGKD